MITSLYAIPIWLAVIFIVSLAASIYWGSKEVSARTFVFTLLCVAALTASIGYFLFSTNYSLQEFGIKLTFSLAAVTAISLLYFVISFTTKHKASFGVTSLMIGALVGIIYSIIYTDRIATPTVLLAPNKIGVVLGWNYGDLAWIFHLFILLSYGIALLLLISSYKQSVDPRYKKSVIIFALGLIVGVVSQVFFNNILPFNQIYEYVWLGPTSAIIWVPMLAYSITRNKHWNVRMVATEAIVMAMVLSAFFGIFLSTFLNDIQKISIFIGFTLLGLYMIKSALRESEQKEELRYLNENLQKRVDEQIKEIRDALEVERSARQELQKIDEAKNQFTLITQHHLRTPITSIKWQLEAISGGTYGPLPHELKEPVVEMAESIDRLNHLINSLLSISALKAGVETLQKVPTNIRSIIDDILKELAREIERKKLSIRLPNSKGIWPAVPVDKSKIRESLFIIIENAVRYNIEGGYIEISSKANESTFELTVENTGQPLSQEDKSKIFTELFYRSNKAQTENPTGIGIGLSMAQAVIQAHKGSISINSRKDGGGVKVVVSLPY